MVTTIRPNHKPGKLSSKFGAAFAAFEKNNNVPQAFRCADWGKSKVTSTHTKTLKLIEASKETLIKASKETPTTQTLGAYNDPQVQRRGDQENSRPNIQQEDHPTKSVAIADNRFSSIDLPKSSTSSEFVARDKKPSTESILSDSTSASKDTSCHDHRGTEDNDITRTAFNLTDDDSEYVEYIEIVVISENSSSSDDEYYEEYWEEETLDSTYFVEEDESVWEELIADGDIITECRSVG